MPSERFAVSLLLVLLALSFAPSGSAQDSCDVSTAGSSPREGGDAPVSPSGAAGELAALRVGYDRANALRRALDAPLERFDTLVAQALEGATSLADPVERATVELHVGRSLMLREQQVRATLGPDTPERRALVVRAGSVLAGAARLAHDADAQRIRSFADGYRATLYADAGRYEEASILNESALVGAASIPDRVLLARWSGERGRLLEALSKPEAAIAAYRSARAHLEQVRAGLPPDAFLELARPIVRSLADLLLRSSAGAAGSGEQALREAQQSLEILKVAEIRDYFDDPCLGAQRTTLAAEIPGATVLYPVVLEDRTELLVIRAGRYHRFVSPVPGAEILREALRFTSRLQDPTTFRYRAPASRLYELLIQPAAALLIDPNATLVVVPPPELAQVPFAALLDPASKSFLIEQVPVAVTPSLILTEPRPVDRDGINTLVAGLTTDVEGFDRLRFVDEEVGAVRTAFPGDTLEGEAFTAEALAARFATKPYGILHIASHGVFGGDARDSFVLTHEGRLSMDRLAEIVQQARFRTDRALELLTLSACETAVGDPRAVLGLAGVAVQSGARSALGSLWKVSDEATHRLIATFYRELAKSGVSRAVALQRAQRELLAERPTRHPVYWASFVVINSWL